MPEDLRELPRLPLDTADYVAIKEGDLDTFITFEPGEPVYQLSLLDTLTPEYWPSAFGREVYDRDLSAIFPDQADAEAAARPVLQEFAKLEPRPPQWRGILG